MTNVTDPPVESPATMDLEFTLPVTAGAFVAVIVLGVLAMLFTPAGEAMGEDTILTMVAPSMIVFGLVCLALGVKHGEYRAATR